MATAEGDSGPVSTFLPSFPSSFRPLSTLGSELPTECWQVGRYCLGFSSDINLFHSTKRRSGLGLELEIDGALYERVVGVDVLTGFDGYVGPLV